ADLRNRTTVRFSDLSLPEALRRLLGKTSYALLEKGQDAPRDARFILVVVGKASCGQFPGTSFQKSEEREAGAPTEASVRSAIDLNEAFENGDLNMLQRSARSGDVTGQAVALKLLSQSDPEEAKVIALSAARSSNLDAKLNGLQVLGEIDDPESTAALGAALKDRSLAVRQAAVTNLLNQSGPEAVRLLTLASKDQDPAIRIQAVDFLAQREAQVDGSP